MEFNTQSNNVEIVAHRGYAALYPENTMVAFRRSLELGADTIELDIHYSKEGIPVVIHDDTLDRTTTSSGSIRKLSLQDIRQADAGVKFSPEFVGSQVPLLEEALDLCSGRAGLQLELKETITESEGRALLHLLKVHDMLDHTMIISFIFTNLTLMRELHPHIELGFLTDKRVSLQPLHELGHATCCFSSSLAMNHPDMLEEATSLGIDRAVWTIRDEETAIKLYKLGIRRLTSDIPLTQEMFTSI